MNLYVYDMGIIDFFKGMVQLEDYINLLSIKEHYPSNMGNDYMSHKELKEFLIKCFMEIKILNSYWDGDITTIAISAIPQPTTQEPFKMIAFKQSNNGHSFLISECKIDINYESDFEIKFLVGLKDFGKEDLFLWFDKSYTLVEELFYRALIRKYSSTKENDHIKLMLCPFHEEKTPSFSIDKENKTYYCFGCGIKGKLEKETNDTLLSEFDKIG